MEPSSVPGPVLRASPASSRGQEAHSSRSERPGLHGGEAACSGMKSEACGWLHGCGAESLLAVGYRY